MFYGQLQSGPASSPRQRKNAGGPFPSRDVPYPRKTTAAAYRRRAVSCPSGAGYPDPPIRHPDDRGARRQSRIPPYPARTHSVHSTDSGNGPHSGTFPASFRRSTDKRGSSFASRSRKHSSIEGAKSTVMVRRMPQRTTCPVRTSHFQYPPALKSQSDADGGRLCVHIHQNGHILSLTLPQLKEDFHQTL